MCGGIGKGVCVKSLDRYARLTDEELMQFSRQNPDAFGELYQRYQHEMFAFVRAHLHGNVEAAEDVVSQVFSNAFRARHRYQERTFRGWLYTIARNALKDSYRRSRPFIPIDAFGDIVSREQSVLDQITQREAAEELWASVSRLPPPQDAILELRLAGLTAPQIAERLGMTREAVRSSMYRAFTRLRGQAGTRSLDR